MIAAAYLDYVECLETEQAKVGKSYAECPVVCPDGKDKYDLHRTEHCRGCPKKKHWKAFRDDTDELWVKWFGEDHEHDFDRMYDVMLAVDSLEDVPLDRLSFKNRELLRVCRMEKRKADLRRAKAAPQ